MTDACEYLEEYDEAIAHARWEAATIRELYEDAVRNAVRGRGSLRELYEDAVRHEGRLLVAKELAQRDPAKLQWAKLREWLRTATTDPRLLEAFELVNDAMDLIEGSYEPCS